MTQIIIKTGENEVHNDCKSQYQLQMLSSVVPAAKSVTTHADARLCLALSTWIYELGKEERESKAHVPFNHGISKHEENADSARV
jgi:hypothetical protein